MAIELDRSKFGTKNGTTDLIGMSRNLYHKEIILIFAPEIVSRVGHEIVETIAPTRQ